MKWLCLLVTVVVSAGCSPDATRIQLMVDNPAGLALDGLALWTPGGDRRVIDMGPAVEVVVPDAWAGAEQHFVIEGTLAGYKDLSKADRLAIAQYLKTIPPIKNKIGK